MLNIVKHNMKTPLKYNSIYSQLSNEEEIIFEETKKSIADFVRHSSRISDVNYVTRNAHAKTYIALEGKFIPEQSAKSLLKDTFFEKEYKIVVRLSNANLKIPKGINDLPAYGFAIKILDKEENTMANYPLVNFPLFPINSVSRFLKLFTKINRFFIDKKKILPLLGEGLQLAPQLVSLDLLKKSLELGLKSHHFFLSFPFYSIGAYRLGDYMIKLKIVPRNVSYKIRNGFLPKTLDDYFQQNSYNADVFIQYCYNEKDQPINILNREWKNSPFIKIGQIHIPQSSILNHHYLENELLSFNPFDNQKNLKPVGKIQKLREKAYQVSFNTREKVNTLLHPEK